MRQPLVTLCVPAYNAEQTLAGTLESLVRQTYQPIEIHVVDDASTDATAAIARSFGPKVSVHTNPTNLGLRLNWEKCMRLGTGEYRALYHADDLYEPDIVGTEVAFLEAHPDVGVVFSAAWLIDENGAPHHRARTEPSEFLRLMDRWLDEEGVREHVTEADRALRAELGRRDQIERAARALLLDRVGLARRLLAEAAETRGYPRSRSALKYSILARATAAACWP